MEDSIPAVPGAIAAIPDQRESGDVKYRDSIPEWDVSARDVLDTELADDVVIEGAALDVGSGKVNHTEPELVYFIGADHTRIREHTVLDKNVDVVALVGQDGGNVANVFIAAIAEEPGVGWVAHEVDASGHLVSVGIPTFGIDIEARFGGRACVGHGHILLKNRGGHGREAVGGDDVAGEWEDGRDLALGIIGAGGRIVDQSRGRGKVAGALGRERDGGYLREAFPLT